MQNLHIFAHILLFLPTMMEMYQQGNKSYQIYKIINRIK